MSTLIGGVVLASALFGVLVGQIAAGAEFAGVVIASLVVMSLQRPKACDSTLRTSGISRNMKDFSSPDRRKGRAGVRAMPPPDRRLPTARNR